MSTLERHCQLLLRAYPAAYREARGEEIIGTLLQATPPGQDWPQFRDARALVIAGLRARAAQNRRLTTIANVRTAALIGVVAYLGLSIGGCLSVLVLSELSFPGGLILPSWAELVLAAFLSAAAVLAWVSRRRVLVLAGVLPAAAIACLATRWNGGFIWPAVTQLVCLAALLVLAGGAELPSPRWLWPVGIISAAPILADLRVVNGRPLAAGLVLAVVLACIAWITVDARPAIAVAVFLLLFSMTVFGLSLGGPVRVPLLVVIGVLASLALWRLRRQSARAARPPGYSA